MDKIYLYSSYCCASEESNDHPDVFKAKFVVSDFSVNRNNVKLNQDTFQDWMNTLVGKPLVGKLVTSIIGESDFTGHNMKEIRVVDKDGNEQKTYEFDTQAFGVFTAIGIETIDNNDYIVASCDIWKRFPKACSVIQKRIAEGTLNTSWEIDVISSHKETINGNIVKVIDQGNFIGHCLLGKNTVPAYDCSKLLEVAEANKQDVDEELSGALSQDVLMLRSISKKSQLEKEEVNLHLKDEKESGQIVASYLENKALNNNSDNDAESAACKNPGNKKEDAACDPKKKEEDAACNPDKKDKEDAACDPDKKKEDAACDPDKKKEEAACDPDKKDKETSSESDQSNNEPTSNSQMESSASGPKLTSNDLTRNIYEALEYRKIYSYIEFHFPLDKTIWVKDESRDAGQLDYIVFTYEVNSDGTVTLSDPHPARLTVEFKEMNSKFNEMVNAIAQANAEISKKDREIASLMPYKKQVEEENANKAAIEKAEKVQKLRDYALNSMLISEAEISEGGELAKLVEDLDETGIKTIIAERYMSKNNNHQQSVETSSAANTDKQVVKHDLTSFQDESANNYKDVLRSYFKK